MCLLIGKYKILIAVTNIHINLVTHASVTLMCSLKIKYCINLWAINMNYVTVNICGIVLAVLVVYSSQDLCLGKLLWPFLFITIFIIFLPLSILLGFDSTHFLLPFCPVSHVKIYQLKIKRSNLSSLSTPVLVLICFNNNNMF